MVTRSFCAWLAVAAQTPPHLPCRVTGIVIRPHNPPDEQMNIRSRGSSRTSIMARTTLSACLLKQSAPPRQPAGGRARPWLRTLERERCITILANATSSCGRPRVHIATRRARPHFGGESRAHPVDGPTAVVLLVDAAEGPLPQTIVLGN